MALKVLPYSGHLYDNESEMKLHTEAVRRIALHHPDVPEEQVIRIYEIVLRHFKAEARVRDFLIILTGKRVEQLLQKWKGSVFGNR